ncbi:MAG TPA: SAM-dependent chlorinase/fluorinase [Thermoleophilaceae bacterium]|nr:SAM-dependent chlorinase/fluorinase [Thermoleophilaceae bacterium]
MIITLLTDYGREDEFVGVCHAVIRGIHPGAEIVDLTHGIPRHAVRQGAVVLRNALPYLPAGVHVGIVDPGVGSERRAVAVTCADGRTLVGPDNGLLSLAWQEGGGVVEAVDASRSPHRLEPVSATFHGRDVFAPVAAHLATGEPLPEAGEPLDPADLVVIELPTVRRDGSKLLAHAVGLDRFGNVALNASRADLAELDPGATVVVESRGERFPGRFARTFADVKPGELILYEDANRSLAVALNRGDAATTLDIGLGDEVRLSPR